VNVLVIEDEPRLAELIAKTLRREFLDATVRTDGGEGFDEALTGAYDVIVLDRMLPSMDGMTILEGLRRQRVDTPVLMLTALGDVPDRIQGLRAGADDYLGKPFSFDELLARIRALGRRSHSGIIHERQQFGEIEIDLSRRSVSRGDQPIELSPREFALLETLVRHKGQVLSRDQLLHRVWGSEADPTGNVVDLYVHYLRKKLDSNPSSGPSLIRTVRGYGYSLG
jgi:two-component system OmpR family response regulator